MSDVAEGLTIRFWGTRGSIPTPGRATEKYGGNTPCLEVRHGNHRIVIDAGTGIREMTTAWLAEETNDTPTDVSLLFTHLHWDHIQGFPFFAFAYMPQNSLTVYGEAEKPVEELLSGQMSGDYFPVDLNAMQAKMTFRKVDGPFQVGAVKITPFKLPHPGASLGYRLEVGESVLVVATDSEFDDRALNKDQLEENRFIPREYPPELLEVLSGASLLVIDCQYTDELYEKRRGWGHNSAATVVDLCRQIQPDMVALFHHDPESTDEMVTAMADDVARRLIRSARRALVFAAREGLEIRVAKPKPPPALVEG